MKKVILWVFCFLLLIIFIPICAGIKTNDTNKTNTSVTEPTETANKTELSQQEIEYVVCNVMEFITEDCNEECKAAVLTLCVNNAIYSKINNIELSATQISDYSDEFREELITMYENSVPTLLFEGNIVYIPIADSSPGYTVTDKTYPYILSVASPWDKFDENYNQNNTYPCGVSVNGIEYLCQSGSTCEEALKWYLPNFIISN